MRRNRVTSSAQIPLGVARAKLRRFGNVQARGDVAGQRVVSGCLVGHEIEVLP